ncbi:MAG: hypothetical protein IT360_27825 [Gemmatimonadaceae bacterium]|nr:hypothetical protein [Gemmatimonadaceae bacterium]
MPPLGTALLVPTVPFRLIALQAMLRALRIGARRRFLVVPARAITARLFGPALAALLAPVAALVLMVGGVQGQGPASTVVPASLLPPSTLPHAAVLASAGFGGLAFLLGAGMRFGRGGRIGADLVLAAYCATQLLHPQFAGERDPTPAAPAVALLMANGLLTAIAAATWCLRGRFSGGRPG